VRSVIVLPGRAPQWVTDHARDVAQRLSDHGAVLVAFMRRPGTETPLPGQSPQASVLGHSAAGQPLWTGRIGAGVGLLPRHRVAVVVVWNGTGAVASLIATIAARLRGDYVILDVVDAVDTSGPLRRLTNRLVHDVVDVRADLPTGPEERTLLALCGGDSDLARLVLESLDSMGADAAQAWRCEIRVDESVLDEIGAHEPRHSGLVEITVTDGESLGPADADVVLAAAAGDETTVVRESVATGGAGVLVGSVRTQVARCHDGVWLARRDVAALLVAIEASGGRTRRTPVAILREAARRLERLVWDFDLQQRERWAGRPHRHREQVAR
jgi:hypothetical protein